MQIFVALVAPLAVAPAWPRATPRFEPGLGAGGGAEKLAPVWPVAKAETPGGRAQTKTQMGKFHLTKEIFKA